MKAFLVIVMDGELYDEDEGYIEDEKEMARAIRNRLQHLGWVEVKEI